MISNKLWRLPETHVFFLRSYSTLIAKNKKRMEYVVDQDLREHITSSLYKILRFYSKRDFIAYTKLNLNETRLNQLYYEILQGDVGTDGNS